MLTIRASALGSCTKALIADLLGYQALPVSDQMQAIFDRGNEHEEVNAAALQMLGYVITDTQKEVSLAFGGIQVVGHLDGLINTNDCAPEPLGLWKVWESKSPGAWAKFETAARTNIWVDPLVHRYAWQISAYMIALDMEAMVTCLDGEEVKSFVIEVPPFHLTDIESRCLEIAEAVALGQLPVGCSQNDYPCPFAYLHETPEHDEDEWLDTLVDTYAEACRNIATYTEVKAEYKEKIEAHLGDREQVNTTRSKVSRYTQKNPDKVDKDALRRDGLYETYVTPGGDSTRIKITSRDE
jgi:hypothetical protein